MVSVVTTATFWPAITERAANLAMVTVLPTPGGPISMTARSLALGSGAKLKPASRAPAKANAGSATSIERATRPRRLASALGTPWPVKA